MLSKIWFDSVQQKPRTRARDTGIPPAGMLQQRSSSDEVRVVIAACTAHFARLRQPCERCGQRRIEEFGPAQAAASYFKKELSARYELHRSEVLSSSDEVRAVISLRRSFRPAPAALRAL